MIMEKTDIMHRCKERTFLTFELSFNQKGRTNMNELDKSKLNKKNQMAVLNATRNLTVIEVIMYVVFTLTLIFSAISFYTAITSTEYIVNGFIYLLIAILFFATGRIINGIEYNRNLLKEIYIEIKSLKE